MEIKNRILIKGDRITVPEFEIPQGNNTFSRGPQVKFSDLKTRQYNIIDRAQEKAKKEIAEEIKASAQKKIDLLKGQTEVRCNGQVRGEVEVEVLPAAPAVNIRVI